MTNIRRIMVWASELKKMEEIDKEAEMVRFLDLWHHDEIYRKK